MGRRALRLAILSFFLSLAPGHPLRAQAVEPRTPVKRLALGGRVHLQYATSSAAGVPASQFVLRRGRLFADVQVNDWIEGAVQVDFSGGGICSYSRFSEQLELSSLDIGVLAEGISREDASPIGPP